MKHILLLACLYYVIIFDFSYSSPVKTLNEWAFIRLARRLRLLPLGNKATRDVVAECKRYQCSGNGVAKLGKLPHQCHILVRCFDCKKELIPTEVSAGEEEEGQSEDSNTSLLATNSFCSRFPVDGLLLQTGTVGVSDDKKHFLIEAIEEAKTETEGEEKEQDIELKKKGWAQRWKEDFDEDMGNDYFLFGDEAAIDRQASYEFLQKDAEYDDENVLVSYNGTRHGLLSTGFLESTSFLDESFPSEKFNFPLFFTLLKTGPNSVNQCDVSILNTITINVDIFFQKLNLISVPFYKSNARIQIEVGFDMSALSGSSFGGQCFDTPIIWGLRAKLSEIIRMRLQIPIPSSSLLSNDNSHQALYQVLTSALRVNFQFPIKPIDGYPVNFRSCVKVSCQTPAPWKQRQQKMLQQQQQRFAPILSSVHQALISEREATIQRLYEAKEKAEKAEKEEKLKKLNLQPEHKRTIPKAAPILPRHVVMQQSVLEPPSQKLYEQVIKKKLLTKPSQEA